MGHRRLCPSAWRQVQKVNQLGVLVTLVLGFFVKDKIDHRRRRWYGYNQWQSIMAKMWEYKDHGKNYDSIYHKQHHRVFAGYMTALAPIGAWWKCKRWLVVFSLKKWPSGPRFVHKQNFAWCSNTVCRWATVLRIPDINFTKVMVAILSMHIINTMCMWDLKTCQRISIEIVF